jgi:16S rRNA (uracil1498-N3)-methyltransferase
LVERDDQAPVATFFVDSPMLPSAITTLGESAAHHARVKRLDVADIVRLTDGIGHVATGTIATLRRASVDVAVDRVDDVRRLPEIHLRVPVGDRDRMLWLAEKATELGIATWQAVRFRRSASVSSRGEGPAFTNKVRARMMSALEQSGGAWLPEIKPDVSVDALTFAERENPIALDRAGEPLVSVASVASNVNVQPVVVFGPEGGIERDELDRIMAAGWRRASLGPTTLRFETAGIAAIAVLRAAQLNRS